MEIYFKIQYRIFKCPTNMQVYMQIWVSTNSHLFIFSIMRKFWVCIELRSIEADSVMNGKNRNKIECILFICHVFWTVICLAYFSIDMFFCARCFKGIEWKWQTINLYMEFILNRGICFANSVLTNSIVKLSFVLKFDYLFAERHSSFSAFPLNTGVVKSMIVSCQFYLDILN